MPRPTRFADTPGQLHVASICYDFDADGGAGDGDFLLPGVIPARALLLNGVVSVLKDLTSEGVFTTVALRLIPDDEYIVADEDLTGWTTGGRSLKVTDLLKAGNYDPLIIKEDCQISLDATDALTGGKFVLYLTYVMALDEIID